MRQVQNIPGILSSLQLVRGLLSPVFWDQTSPSQTHTWFLKLKFRVLIFCCWLRSKRLKEGSEVVALTRKGEPPLTCQTLWGIPGSSFFFLSFKFHFSDKETEILKVYRAAQVVELNLQRRSPPQSPCSFPARPASSTPVPSCSLRPGHRGSVRALGYPIQVPR